MNVKLVGGVVAAAGAAAAALFTVGNGTLERPARVVLAVDSAPAVEDVRRIGVNLGKWETWGAAQLPSNVLQNPGFEGTFDRAVTIVARASPGRYADDQAWLGRADGFWAGGTWNARTGRLAGRSGSVVDSRSAGSDGLPEMVLAEVDAVFDAGDVVVLTRMAGDVGVPNWSIPASSVPYVRARSDDRRPGSPGERSLALSGRSGEPTEVIAYLDNISDRAGKLLPVRGPWRLAFWSRRTGGATLRVTLRRGSVPILDAVVPAPARPDAWEETVLDFEGVDAGPAATLELHFAAGGSGGTVLLDDVELRSRASTGPFRGEVVSALRTMRPGYLRDWQGQLGDTLANRLAVPGGRRASRYRPGDLNQSETCYSLPDFLDLCQEVAANPWVVLPTTFSDDEFLDLGRFLASRHARSPFREVVVEFGNENWNALFRPAGIPEPVAHGEAAQRAFRLVRQGAGEAFPLVTAINAQAGDPARAARFAAGAPGADLVAFAPYYLFSLPVGLSDEQRLGTLFESGATTLADAARPLAAARRQIAVYEVNAHTTSGAALPAERDPLIAGAASGAALARTLIEGLGLGARRQCVWELAGYDNFLDGGKSLVKLWGVARDLGDTCRLRPTGLAIALLNRAIGGTAHAARQTRPGPRLTAAAFVVDGGWRAVVASSSPLAVQVEVRFPTKGVPLPSRLLVLAAPSPLATNEEEELVKIVEKPLVPKADSVSFELPPYGLAAVVGPGA